jgi:hypothetical protein
LTLTPLSVKKYTHYHARLAEAAPIAEVRKRQRHLLGLGIPNYDFV